MEGMSTVLLPSKDELQFGGPKAHDHNPNGFTDFVGVKQEGEDEIEVGEVGGFGKNGVVSLSVSKMEDEELVVVPKPLGKLLDLGPPPFLTKTYEIVENPENDEIVSWGGNGVSFVVWDPHKFSTDLLPKFFKHGNFSSFVRQLNTYGFKKVHLERWEFANSGFQRGKRHLLKTIKRKTHGASNSTRLQHYKDMEIEKLKQEQEAMKAEIHDLKQQQLNSDKNLAAMEDRMKSVEWKQKDFLLLVAKAMKKTPLFQQLLQTYKLKKAIEDGQAFKKRRLVSNESVVGSFLDGLNKNSGCVQEDDPISIKLEANVLASSPVGPGRSSMQEQKSSLTSETSSPDLSSGSYIMWEKLMEDDVICEEDREDAFAAVHNNFVHELEDLIMKPPVWSRANTNEVACPAGQ